MVFSEADEKRLEALKVSLEQARAGTHSRIVQEEKRLRSVKGSKFGKAERALARGWQATQRLPCIASQPAFVTKMSADEK